MKDVLALKTAITDEKFYASMFDDENYGDDKNILFVSPQLSGRHFYKSILPFYCMEGDKNEEGGKNVGVAITSLKQYNYENQLLEYQIVLTDEMVEWADCIVFPFTTQPIVEEIYTRIRELKPEAKIIYNVDFNFYELSVNHPFKEIFSDESVIDDVESNMFFADRVFTTNVKLTEYIIAKFDGLQKTKFKDVIGYMSICAVPIMINSDIMLKNFVEWSPVMPSEVKPQAKEKAIATVNTPEINNKIDKVNKVFDKVVKESKKSNELIVKEKTESWKKNSNKKLAIIEENKKNERSRKKTTAAGKSKSIAKPANKSKSGTGKPKTKPKPAKRRK